MAQLKTYYLGKILPTFKGTYNASTAYETLDVVLYNGSSYVALEDSTGKTPTAYEGVANYWLKIASAGTWETALESDKTAIKNAIKSYFESTPIVKNATWDGTNSLQTKLSQLEGGISGISQTANQAASTASYANSNANSAAALASTAKSTADSAKASATAAQTTANTALSNANSALGKFTDELLMHTSGLEVQPYSEAGGFYVSEPMLITPSDSIYVTRVSNESNASVDNYNESNIVVVDAVTVEEYANEGNSIYKDAFVSASGFDMPGACLCRIKLEVDSMDYGKFKIYIR